MVVNDASAQDELPFTYDEFKRWYEAISADRLEPARETVVRLLGQLMDEHDLAEFDRVRIRLAASRVKAAPRVWAKLDQLKYRPQITKLDDIPMVLDDLVGLRIVCNNISDIKTVMDMLSNLADSFENSSEPLSLQSASERKWLDPPKETGYRAYHINLQTRVHGYKRWHDVTAELQVRTLLQDGWGELTHEDTYKTALKLPPLAQTLAKRMANLLSCVDEIAQDLRDELDALAKNPEEPATPSDLIFESSFAETHLSEPLGTKRADSFERIPEEALLQETRSLVSEIRRPTSLASIAHSLQALFGQDIARMSWGRFGSFKALLLEAVPDAKIINLGPGMLIPREIDPSVFNMLDQTSTADSQEADIPRIMTKLRVVDHNAPAVEAETLAHLLEGVEVSLRDTVWDSASIPHSNLGLKEINLLSKYTRDLLRDDQGTDINRAKLGYLLTALLFTGNLKPGLPISSAEPILSNYLKSRIERNSIAVQEEELVELDEWFERAVALKKCIVEAAQA
jgi:ppGpp synthetase/RelA/SpoT-type nucleotidyltranferase